MSQIEVSIYDQTAVFTNTPDIFSGDVNTDTVKFTFDDSWNTFDEKTAIFYNEPKTSYPVILNNANTVVIPSNVIDRKTTMYFGVIGTKADGSVKTSNILSYRIENGAITADTETPYPSTDVWLQILANYEIALKKCDDMSKNIENMNEKVDDFITMFDEPNVVKTLEKINLTVAKSVNNIKPIDGNVPLSMDNIYSGKNYPKYTVQFGSGTFEGLSNSGTVNIAFEKPFKSKPVVFASIHRTDNFSAWIYPTNISTTGFTADYSGNHPYSWVAFGDVVPEWEGAVPDAELTHVETGQMHCLTAEEITRAFNKEEI